MKSKLLLALIVLGFNLQGLAQGVPAFVRDSIDTYVFRARHDWQIPGVAVCIVKDGKVVLSKGYGVKRLRSNDPVDENTLFMIGSNTKAITATAIAMLHEQKKLSLNDKVTKHLHGFRMRDALTTRELMVSDLLSHRIGMETFQGDFMYWTSDLNSAQVLEKFGKLKPMYSLRSKWGYTNAAFVAAGEIINRITGKTWSKYVTDSIFRPLGMNSTIALSKDLPTASNKAFPHSFNHDQQMETIPFCAIDNLAPAASVSSSVADMAKWVIMQLDNGKLNGKQVIPANALTQTKTPFSILGNGGHPFNKSHFALYGLGWFLEEYSGRKIVSHTGGVNGFVTSVTLVPEENLGVVVLTNTDQNAFYEALKWEIIDSYLNLPYRNYSNFYLQNARQQLGAAKKEWESKKDSAEAKPKPALPLERYTGAYQHEAYGKLYLSKVNDYLLLKLEHHSELLGTLQPLGGNRFLCTYSDPVFGRKVLTFTQTGNTIKSMTLRVADFVEFTPYEFIKL